MPQISTVFVAPTWANIRSDAVGTLSERFDLGDFTRLFGKQVRIFVVDFTVRKIAGKESMSQLENGHKTQEAYSARFWVILLSRKLWIEYIET
jgi:hypothetical protein